MYTDVSLRLDFIIIYIILIDSIPARPLNDAQTWRVFLWGF